MSNEEQNPIEAEGEQATLAIDLPEYNGTPAVGMKTSINGTGNRLGTATRIGERRVLVVEVVTKKVGHEGTEKGIFYTETRTVSDLFELERDAGSRMLKFLRSNYQTARNEARGEPPIEELSAAGYTDENGVVLTPKEVAERQGDPVRMLSDEKQTPAVVMYEDHSRLLWPDEYPKDTPRPHPGQETDDGLVVELLHHETGERIAWLETSPEPEFDIDDTDQADGPSDVPVDRGELEQVAEAAVVAEQSTVTRASTGEVVLSAVPDLPGEDDDGGYGDAADDWDDPATVRKQEPPAHGEVSKLDEAFVDRVVSKIKIDLENVDDPEQVKRYIEAEKQGRGRKMAPRRTALDALYARLEELGRREAMG